MKLTAKQKAAMESYLAALRAEESSLHDRPARELETALAHAKCRELGIDRKLLRQARLTGSNPL